MVADRKIFGNIIPIRGRTKGWAEPVLAPWDQPLSGEVFSSIARFLAVAKQLPELLTLTARVEKLSHVVEKHEALLREIAEIAWRQGRECLGIASSSEAMPFERACDHSKIHRGLRVGQLELDFGWGDQKFLGEHQMVFDQVRRVAHRRCHKARVDLANAGLKTSGLDIEPGQQPFLEKLVVIALLPVEPLATPGRVDRGEGIARRHACIPDGILETLV